ncbi:MAG: sodium-dependent transporter [Lachnospirales bacterium]
MEKEKFKSKFGVIAATAGSAVGLGNIWGFSYKAGVNGGGTFVLIYLLCILLIGAPVMLAEFIIGREGKGGPVGSIEKLGGKNNFFVIGGYLGSISTFLILAFYSVIAGWTIKYLSFTLVNGFKPFATSESSNAIFETFAATNIAGSTICQIIFMILTVIIVTFGIQNGIERFSKIMMPLLFGIILVMVVYSFTLPGFGDAVKFLFVPSKLPETTSFSQVMASAMGHAFFTLSLGMGAIITYARAVGDDLDLKSITFQVCVTDTAIALLAGLATFPIIFSITGLEPGQGAGLAFMSLPVAFAQMPGGYILGNLFFFLLFVAALTSSIAMLENTLTTILEKTKLNRKLGAIVLGIIITFIGYFAQIGANFSMPILNFTGETAFLDQLNLFTANYTIPIGALFIIILIGWRMDKNVIRRQINDDRISNIFIPYVKYVVPVLVALVFILSVTGVIQN